MYLSLATALAAPVSTPAPETYDPRVSLSPLVEAVTPAVVAVEVEAHSGVPEFPPELRRYFPIPEMPDIIQGEGSGFFISSDGLVLTNYHVVDGAEKVEVRLSDGRTVGASVVGADAALDVALLRVEEKGDWPHLELGDSGSAKVGDWVVAVGNPLGLGLTVTTGIVSGKGRVLHHDNVFGSDDFLQTDAAINQGNSGGPLFSLDGKVIGINTAIIMGANTVGFAIPIDLVENALPDLEKNGRVSRGFIGVKMVDLTPELAEYLGIEPGKGVLVGDVIDGSPAQDAGIRKGDLIVAVDGEDVMSNPELVRQIAAHKPGDQVTVTVLRDGQKKKLTLKVVARTDADLQ